MHTFTKKILPVAIVMLLVLVTCFAMLALTGCGGGGDDKEEAFKALQQVNTDVSNLKAFDIETKYKENGVSVVEKVQVRSESFLETITKTLEAADGEETPTTETVVRTFTRYIRKTATGAEIVQGEEVGKIVEAVKDGDDATYEVAEISYKVATISDDTDYFDTFIKTKYTPDVVYGDFDANKPTSLSAITNAVKEKGSYRIFIGRDGGISDTIVIKKSSFFSESGYRVTFMSIGPEDDRKEITYTYDDTQITDPAGDVTEGITDKITKKTVEIADGNVTAIFKWAVDYKVADKDEPESPIEPPVEEGKEEAVAA